MEEEKPNVFLLSAQHGLYGRSRDRALQIRLAKPWYKRLGIKIKELRDSTIHEAKKRLQKG